MTSGTTRLHIAPLTPALLETVLNPSLRSSAQDISFHTLETFPENSYGYVNLPTMEAEKVKKKLNGSILKGKKMKVEEAKPKKRHHTEEDASFPADANSGTPGPKKPSKKRKGESDVLPGHELSPKRHVKRGWTEPGKREKQAHKSKSKDSKSSSQRSKYTEKPECIFRTNPPANQAAVEKAEKKESNTKKKGKDAVVVHEFAKTVKHPTFLRSGENVEEATLTDGFVEGKGWVNRGGDVKEPIWTEETKDSRKTPGRAKGGKDKITKPKHFAVKESSLEVSSTEPSSSESSSSATSSSEDDTDTADSDDDDSETTSSASSENDSSESSSSDEDEEDNETKLKNLEITKATPALTENPLSPDTPMADSLGESKNGNPTTPGPVHPLEALFKLSTPTPKSASRPSLEIKTQFSFFGEDNDENDGDGINAEGSLEPPQTPFTRQDLRTRTIRSAAPTPDTAAPQRISFWEEKNDNDNEDYDDYEGDDEYPEDNGSTANGKLDAATLGKGKGKAAGGEGGDFASWFWENRGENNRAWKKRRREAAKEKRQRDNRRKGTKGK